MELVYKTEGTCRTHIEIAVEDGIVSDIAFWGGCSSNLQGLSRLVKDMEVNEVVTRLAGIKCGRRSTSCPDQLSKALRNIQK